MGDDGVSRFSRLKFLCMPGVFDSAGPLRTHADARSRVAFWRTDTMGVPNREISELNTQPTDAPVQRFECLRPPSHGSGSGWFVTPSLYDSFIRCFKP